MDKTPVTILLVEDSPEDAEVLREAFAKEKDTPFAVTHVSRLADGLKSLARQPFDLVLLDLQLPDSDGIETLVKVRRQAPRVPIVVLTASDDEALASQAVTKGAQDYLVKGYVQVYGNLLWRSVRYAIERQRAEDEVRSAHAQTEQLLSSIPSILIRLSPQGVVTHWNAVAEHTFGIPGASVLGRPLAGCGIGWDMAKVQACIEECRLRGHAVSLDDMAYTRASGKQGFLGITVVPMQGDQQELGVLLFGADVSERKQAETERTRLQSQLMQAQKMETIGRFAGGIAHDFNNFLQVILGFAWLIRNRHPGEGPLMGDLQEIVHAAESASGMVHQLLAFSRKQPLEPKTFEINQTVRNMGRLLQQFVGEAIQVRLELLSTPLMVRMDATGLEQILMNLCSNARDSMPQGGTLTIRTARRLIDDAFIESHPGAQPGDYVALSIQDTGSGMDAAVAAHIFEPFFTTKQTGKGTGLGLAVVYGLVQQHEGFIYLETVKGQGTAFHLYFPRQDMPSEAAAAAPAEGGNGAEAPAPPVARAGKRRVLIVDDDPAIRLLCERILEQTHEVMSVPSGRAALEALGQEGFDLLLTDIRMPNMDGVTLLNEVIKLQRPPKLLAMTGSPAADMEERLARVPLSGHVIRKPFTAPTLLAVISRCFTQPPAP